MVLVVELRKKVEPAMFVVPEYNCVVVGNTSKSVPLIVVVDASKVLLPVMVCALEISTKLLSTYNLFIKSELLLGVAVD